MDPVAVRASRPKLVSLTERAIAIGKPLLTPVSIYERFPVTSLLHNRINLSGNRFLQGDLVSSQLGKSQEIVVAICSIGSSISKFAVSMFEEDPALAMALDGMASVATEALANAICGQINALAIAEGKKASLPINPGMIGWPVEEGQTQIFSLLDASSIGVSLDIAQFIGMGMALESSGTKCDFCVLQKTCQYKILVI